MKFPTLSQLLQRTEEKLELAGLDDVQNAGSVSNLLNTSFMTEVARNGLLTQAVHANSFIQNAVGIYLDLHGEELGLARRSAQPAVVFAADENLELKATTGTLRDRFGNTLPALEVSNADSSKTYTVGTAAIPAGATKMYLTAVCQTTGVAGNCNRNELTVLSTNVSGVVVSNRAPILTGQDIETDDIYRSRLLAVARGAVQVSGSTLVSIAVGVPGVTNATVLNTAFGVAHPALLISGPGQVQAGTVAAAQAAIDSALPFGIRVEVLAPTYDLLDLDIAVQVDESQDSRPTRESLASQVRTMLSTGPGSTIDLDSIDAALTRNNPAVRDVTAVNARLDGRPIANRRLTVDETHQIILGNINVEVV